MVSDKFYQNYANKLFSFALRKSHIFITPKGVRHLCFSTMQRSTSFREQYGQYRGKQINKGKN